MLRTVAGHFVHFSFQRENLVSLSKVEKWGEGKGGVGGVLYGEDESGPCAGDDRSGQRAQSCPFGQWGQQRIMGKERRVWSRPLGPHHQAKASKSHLPFISVSVSVSRCVCLLMIWIFNGYNLRLLDKKYFPSISPSCCFLICPVAALLSLVRCLHRPRAAQSVQKCGGGGWDKVRERLNFWDHRVWCQTPIITFSRVINGLLKADT